MMVYSFDKNRETLLFYPASKRRKIYTVPEGVTKIKDFAFQQNKKFRRIILPDSFENNRNRCFSTYRTKTFIYIQ